VLFLIYINDLPETLHSSAKLFADDCLLYREVNTTSDTNVGLVSDVVDVCAPSEIFTYGNA
jgi:hypothetical protein